jgi:hypothetical protein
VFDESSVLTQPVQSLPPLDLIASRQPSTVSQIFDADDFTPMPTIIPNDSDDEPTVTPVFPPVAPPSQTATALRRSSRPTGPAPRLDYDKLGGNVTTTDVSDVMQVLGSCYNVCSDSTEPNTYDEAVSGTDSAKWIAAMGEEYQALVDNGTWQHVAAPNDNPLLKCRWVYKIKRNESGNVIKYKARLVAKGFTQQHGVNFFETFSPVAKIQTVRLMIFLAAQLNLSMMQFDIPNAYVKAPVHEDIFMQQPEGFNTNDGTVLKLIKALYGTKQAGRCWNIEFTDFLISIGFQQCSHEPCLFHKALNDDLFILLVIYVDDVLTISNSEQSIEALLIQVEAKFSITRLGFPKWFLGIRITKDDTGSIFMDQSKAVLDLLNRFNMESANPTQFPIHDKIQLMPIKDPQHLTDQPFRPLNGSLMYIMVCTRPDLTVPISLLGQFMANPGSQHWNVAKRVVRYLKGTIDLSLAFQPCPDFQPSNMISAYSDSDWGKDPTDRKSFSGYVLFVGSALISWKCRKQSAVALSTAEAEYMALSLIATEVIWMRSLLSEIGFTQQGPSTIYCDNKAAIHMAINDVIGPKSKHISIKFHFIKQAIANQEIFLQYVPTADNLADFMTKPLVGQKFIKFRDALNLQRAPGF